MIPVPFGVDQAQVRESEAPGDGLSTWGLSRIHRHASGWPRSPVRDHMQLNPTAGRLESTLKEVFVMMFSGPCTSDGQPRIRESHTGPIETQSK